MTDTYEHHFITNDGDIFNLIEDESGGVYWGYGHIPAAEFIAEVNRWLLHCGCDPNEPAPESTPVDHLWAKYDNDDDERFLLVKNPAPEDDAFPVTRSWL